jgi:hemoglobin/transferrin/lactoferrin receptor protein
MRRIIYTCIALMLAVPANAQVLTVRDKTTSQPLELVKIYTLHPPASAVTDARGRVEVSEFERADSIRIELMGYKPCLCSYRQLETMRFELLLEQSPLVMDGVVVSATRWKQQTSDVPGKIAVIRPVEVALQNPQTAADLLNASGEVFIQKSQLGGGSPMIRGFATNRVLITVDGVRMNNAIFRSGNLQNVISLDPFATDEVEVVFGPGSVIYGSDAIGGVMSFYTLWPRLSSGDGPISSGQAVVRSSSADFERTGHLDLGIGLKKWGFVTSVTSAHYDDLIMGSRGPNEYLRSQYVATINGKDSTVSNSDPQKQVPSGYRQINLMQKIRFKPNDTWDFNYGFHYSGTSDYPRYDRLLRYRGDNLRSAEWYYGPQVWMMNALNVSNSRDSGWYDNLNLILVYQFFEESRHDRDFGKTTKFHRKETVRALSANLDFEKEWTQRHRLFYGVELVLNRVGSTGEDEDISTGEVKPGPSRYPDGSEWNSYAGYLGYCYKPHSRLTLQSGLRYTRVTLDAEFDTAFYPFPFSTADINTGALNGSLGLVYKPEPSWQIRFNLSTGFRAPNVDDAGKVFDSEPGSVVVPNPDLKSEYAYNAELGISKLLREMIIVDLTAYYTLLEDALARRNFTLNGMDSIYYEGELSRVQAIQNAAQANVWGVQAGMEMKLPSGIGLLSHFSYQKGTEELDDGSTDPLRHAAPWFGDLHLTFTSCRITADLYAICNGEIAYADLAAEERGKDYMYAVDGNGNPYSPGWYTLNFKTSFLQTHSFKLNAGMENITDQRYRPYSSGLVAAGRNFIASLGFSF